ncbi:hypothetical protein BO82DRAFT_362372 [Aspergillus uvarum CBS 121591]|uniref:Transposase Tc1-like domain-containing protein n=1 Tax=Aspergillus uvarum CBS 121591 TaxID=1448315 RepID=A0A319CNS6_9EURO|nr:hypothetical protein BO82DRAFT_362372 [Aspergillus uvarum CBS 121591]PYH84627.1 hypothetical protein BO82DRAFT_362372 [Aspergillus uvarum CBS 121591]
MTRGKEMTPQLRSRICELHSIGWGARKISRVHPELWLSGIKYTIRKEKDHRPKKLSEDQRALIRAMVEADPAVKSAVLPQAVGNAITKRSLQRLLNEKGMGLRA